MSWPVAFSEQAVEFGGDVVAGGVLHPVAEAFGEFAQAFQLDLVGFAVDTVDEGLGVFGGHAVHLAGGGHILGHRAVGEQHEFLDKPVGLRGNLLVDVYGLAVLVDQHLHLGPVEVDCSGLALGGLHDAGEAVEFAYRECEFVGFRHAFGLDDMLRAVIVETAVGTYDGAAYPARAHFGLRAHLEDG